MGLARVIHPFPSALNATITAALILIAGGAPPVAVRLALAMFALQAAIGTANDLIDEPLDAGRKPGKPLPRGLLTRRSATALFAGALVIGLALSALSGAAVLAIAVVGTGIGLVYDRWLKATIWSWLPLAAGISLLPVYAWVGARGALPAVFVILVPAAVVAGAALALANQRADVDRDRAAGAVTTATVLGADRAWTAGAVLHMAFVAVALATIVLMRGRGPGLLAVAGGVVFLVVGLAIGRRRGAVAAELAWEIQAVAVGLLGSGWVAAMVDAGVL